MVLRLHCAPNISLELLLDVRWVAGPHDRSLVHLAKTLCQAPIKSMHPVFDTSKPVLRGVVGGSPLIHDSEALLATCVAMPQALSRGTFQHHMPLNEVKALHGSTVAVCTKHFEGGRVVGEANEALRIPCLPRARFICSSFALKDGETSGPVHQKPPNLTSTSVHIDT